MIASTYYVKSYSDYFPFLQHVRMVSMVTTVRTSVPVATEHVAIQRLATVIVNQAILETTVKRVGIGI